MFAKIMDRVINLLNRARSKLHQKNVKKETEKVKLISLVRYSTPKKEGHEKQQKSTSLTKGKEKTVKQNTHKIRNLQDSLKKSQQINNLVKNEKLSIAAACKRVGLSESYYYKIKNTGVAKAAK